MHVQRHRQLYKVEAGVPQSSTVTHSTSGPTVCESVHKTLIDMFLVGAHTAQQEGQLRIKIVQKRDLLVSQWSTMSSAWASVAAPTHAPRTNVSTFSHGV